MDEQVWAKNVFYSHFLLEGKAVIFTCQVHQRINTQKCNGRSSEEKKRPYIFIFCCGCFSYTRDSFHFVGITFNSYSPLYRAIKNTLHTRCLLVLLYCSGSIGSRWLCKFSSSLLWGNSHHQNLKWEAKLTAELQVVQTTGEHKWVSVAKHSELRHTFIRATTITHKSSP